MCKNPLVLAYKDEAKAPRLKRPKLIHNSPTHFTSIKSPQTHTRRRKKFLSYPFFSASYPEKQGIMSFLFAEIKNATDLWVWKDK